MSDNKEVKIDNLKDVSGGTNLTAQKQKFWVGMGCEYFGTLCNITDVRLTGTYYEYLIEPVHPMFKDDPKFSGWKLQDDLKASGEK